MKKRLLFTAYNLDIGGIEKALVNLLNNIDYSKYEVTLVLEKKEGLFLKDLNKNVIVKELKVSSSKIVPIRKLINFSRKLIFKLKNKNKYDFSCCYATYSYSANKLALIGSSNSSLYVHSNYKDLYTKKEFCEFFNTRNIDSFKHIIFVSNESKDYFEEVYPSLKNKLKVLNNFIDIENVKKLSEEKISEVKPNNKLLVFVGRLDDSSKKLGRAINLVKNIPELELWLIGDGPDRKMYEELVNKNNLNSRVKFLGRKTNPYPYIKLADYYILTSDYEGFPVTYLESLILNKEIITTIPVSDDKIDIRDYAYIVSKDEDKMVKEVKDILNKSRKQKSISIDKIQKERMKDLEVLFNEVI
jgi:glycosyltransferase involved in cell wall biosynthesis